MKRNGFTFIEMLVVITIIAVLTAVGVTNFRVANRKARDGKRQGDLQQIRAALELYRTEEKIYPLSVTFGGTIESPTTTYMDNVPDDPLENYNYYYYSSDGLTYTLCGALELDTAGGCNGAGTGACGEDCNYEINNPL